MKCRGVCTEDLGWELGVTCAHCRSVITSQKSSSNFSAMLSRNRTWLSSTFTHFALLRGSWSEPGCSNVQSLKGQPQEGAASRGRLIPFGRGPGVAVATQRTHAPEVRWCPLTVGIETGL